MENIRKHRDIKLVTADKKRSKLVSEPNYDTINLISEDLSIIDMKKTKVKMNKPIYLGLSILEITKILMYEFWYDYMKPKYGNKVKLCYMDTDSFIMNINTNDFYEDIASDVENRFDTSNYEVNRPLPTGKNKKVIGLMKDELDGKIITEFVTLRPKTYSFLTDDGKEDKKAKGTKKCIIKKMIKFNDYKKCLLNDEVTLKSQQRQYDLDRINAEIPSYSSGDLPKYEYLTKKDLGYKPDAVEKVKFEYSPIGKVFIDGLAKEDKSKKIGLFK